MERKKKCLTLSQRTGVYVKDVGEFLPSGQLKMKSCPDLNAAGVGVEGKLIKNVEFHPWSQVALVSGRSDTVSLYQVSRSHSSEPELFS
jgi:hypothetical protein